jgi:HK97 family phage major capsid protein
MNLTAEQLAALKAVAHKREAIFERASINVEARTVVIAFSSETPVLQRVDLKDAAGRVIIEEAHEILAHDSDSCELERLNTGAPLLFNHDKNQHVGVIEKAWIDADKVGRALVRFSKSVFGEEKFRDVQDGILTKVSVGYGQCEYVPAGRAPDGLYTLRATHWAPHEISLVTIPADNSVGVGRSLSVNELNTDNAANSKPTKHMDRTAENKKLRALADKYASFVKAGVNLREVADSFIDENKTASELQDFVNANLGERAKESNVIDVGFSHKERGQLSFFRAIRAVANKDWSGAQKEREYSDTLAKTVGKAARGFYITTADLCRDITVGTSAAKGAAYNAVPTELQGEVINYLRAKLWTAKAGAKVLTGLSGNVDFLRQSGGAVASWVGENGNAPKTQLTTDLVMLRPKTVTAKTHISRRALLQTGGSIEQMQREDLLNALAGAIDLAAIVGTGLNDTPLGILNTPGISEIALVTGEITYKKVLALMAAVETGNADAETMKWLGSPLVKALLMSTPKAPGGVEGNFVMSNPKELLGEEYISTTLAGANLVRGNFSDLMIGEFGVLDVQVDNDGDTGGIIVRVFSDIDIAVRHAKSFAVAKDLDVTSVSE